MRLSTSMFSIPNRYRLATAAIGLRFAWWKLKGVAVELWNVFTAIFISAAMVVGAVGFWVAVTRYIAARLGFPLW